MGPIIIYDFKKPVSILEMEPPFYKLYKLFIIIIIIIIIIIKKRFAGGAYLFLIKI